MRSNPSLSLSICRFLPSILLFVALAFSGNHDAVGGITYFAIDESSPTSLAKGLTDYSVSEEDGWHFNAIEELNNAITFAVSLPDDSQPIGYQYWRLTVAPVMGEPLDVGFYANAYRWPFNFVEDRPGLDFARNSGAANKVGGYFNVLEAVYAPNGDVERFAVDYTYYQNEDPSRFIVGRLRFNATVPEPSTLALAGIGGLALLVHGMRRKESKSL